MVEDDGTVGKLSSQQDLMFTVYIDDLLLSGPAGRHAQIWAKLRKEGFSLGPPEDLNRFLGRSHSITTAAAQRYHSSDSQASIT